MRAVVANAVPKAYVVGSPDRIYSVECEMCRLSRQRGLDLPSTPDKEYAERLLEAHLENFHPGVPRP